MSEKFYPTAENLGQNCMFWFSVGNCALGCHFPKHELEGRRECEGLIDDVCLFIKDGRTPTSLTEQQQVEIRSRVPWSEGYNLPPGDIK